MEKRLRCFCGKDIPHNEMLVIPSTGLLKGCVSKVCRNCPNKAREAVQKLYAIVCAGCREVVVFGEPYVERRTGFKWEAGKIYHVPNCPQCLNRQIKSSPVIEQKLYYKDHGFHYPDDGEL